MGRGRILEDGLTRKESAFITELLSNGGNGTQAALASYDTTSEDVACSIATDNLAKPRIRARVQSALQNAGNLPEIWASKLLQAIDARKETDYDFPTALRAIELSAKLADAFPDQHRTIDKRSLNLRATMELEEFRGLTPSLKRFAAENGRLPSEAERLQITDSTPDQDD